MRLFFGVGRNNSIIDRFDQISFLGLDQHDEVLAVRTGPDYDDVLAAYRSKLRQPHMSFVALVWRHQNGPNLRRCLVFQNLINRDCGIDVQQIADLETNRAHPHRKFVLQKLLAAVVEAHEVVVRNELHRDARNDLQRALLKVFLVLHKFQNHLLLLLRGNFHRGELQLRVEAGGRTLACGFKLVNACLGLAIVVNQLVVHKRKLYVIPRQIDNELVVRLFEQLRVAIWIQIMVFNRELIRFLRLSDGQTTAVIPAYVHVKIRLNKIVYC